MTNSENANTAPEPTDLPTGKDGAEVTFIPWATDSAPVSAYVDTVPSFTFDLAVLVTPYRFLNWVATIQDKAFSVDLSAFSAERQAGIAGLVDHGLVSERKWTGGDLDGRVTYRVTEAGQARLDAAWAAADLVVVG